MPEEIVPEAVEGADSDLPDHDIDPQRLSDLREVLSQTKLRLIQQILASQTGALSAAELAARNSVTSSTVRDHLSDLRDRSPQIVTSLEATTSPVPNGIPRQYYAVTEYGIELLKQLDLYDQIGLLYDMYEAADLELPDSDDRAVSLEDIEEFEHRPRPDWL